ncbi:uncharacterized protein LOC131692724 [Topomyia yanbarensis]|uniref:uncharacterized protein LOC131692724 n=1 Tax=Topomyia yanbarensis TaxID=2498891 RepID=UPI00273CB924|nr:uncharacterized protein LOC131692724 [Topomyia yanbarensis]
MAFSSQRLFLHVPFKNEKPLLPDRKRSDCQLKTYESCTDLRAWAMNPLLMSQFMMDVVHKARFRRLLLRPDGDYELTREYLLQLSTDELADYVLSLMNEVKKMKSEVHDLTESGRDLGQQLASVQQIAETCVQERELILIQQQSVVIDPDLQQKELADLKETICALKYKADRYDCVMRENLSLRCKLQAMYDENTSNTKRKFDYGACGDTETNTCAVLKAELCIYKCRYDEMQQQRRKLMEELQRAKIGQEQLFKLKNKLINQQLQKEQLQERLDDALIKCDQKEMELKKMADYIAMCNHRLDKLERLESERNRPKDLLIETSSQKSFDSEGSVEE